MGDKIKEIYQALKMLHKSVIDDKELKFVQEQNMLFRDL
jgi:uncharacterized protein YfkK (UPF0435 family)